MATVSKISSKNIRPDIQYLRALAILLVIAYHLPPDYNLEGGFLGVDIFFVISGFVITNSLLHPGVDDTSRFGRYLNFLSKRIQRLLPALIAVLVGGLFLAFLFSPVGSFRDTVDSSKFSAVFSANFYFLKNFSSYWNPQILQTPFVHLWSIAVEFQIYLLWPLLIPKPQKKLSAYVIFGLVSVASFLFFLALVTGGIASIFGQKNLGVAFYFPFSRLWQISLGGFVSILTMRRKLFLTRYSNYFLTLGCISMLISLYGGSVVRDTSFWNVAVSFASAIVIGFHSPQKVAQAAFDRPLRWIGDRSYSIYLWHWPLLVVAIWISGGHLVPAMTAILCSLVVAGFSFRFLEKSRRGFWNLMLLPVSFLVIFAFVNISTTSWFTSTINIQELASPLKFNGPEIDEFVSKSSSCENIGSEIHCKNFDNQMQEIVIIGDSLGYRSFPAIQYWAINHGFNASMMWTGGCGLRYNSCIGDVGSRIYDYLASTNVAALVIAANFDYPANRVNGSEKAGGLLPSCPIERSTSTCKKHLAAVNEFVSRAPAGINQLESYTKNILVSLPFPQQSELIADCINLPVYKRLFDVDSQKRSCGGTSLQWQVDRQGLFPSAIRNSIATHSNISSWDPKDYLCQAGWCPAVVNSGERIMDDAIHFNWPAARFIYPGIAHYLDGLDLKP